MDNNSSDYDDFESDTSTEYVVLMTCAFIVLTIVGIIGNVLVLLTVLLNSSMRTAPNVLLTNLAVGDLLILLFWLPDQYVKTIWDHTKGLSHLSHFMCIATESSHVVSQSISALTLTVLSLDRYVVITSTTGRAVSSLLKFYVAVVAFIWMIGLCFAVPIVYFANYISYLDYMDYDCDIPVNNTDISYEDLCEGFQDVYMCIQVPHWSDTKKAYEICRATWLYILPVLIIGTSYSLMSRKLISSLRNVRRLSSRTSSRSQQTRTRKRLAVVVLVIAILFALCWLPEIIISLIRSVNVVIVHEMNTFFVQDWAPLFIYINCCANPIALGFTSLTFRRYFKRYLMFEFVRRTRLDETTGSEYRYISQTNRLKHVNKHTESIETTEIDKA